MLDSGLAALFGVKTERLNEQITRNQERFRDFAIRLTKEEWRALIPRDAGSSGHGGRRKPPFVLTEDGAAMAATVLKSPAAARGSRIIVTAFVEARRASPALPAPANALAPVHQGDMVLPGLGGRGGLAAKLNEALGRVLDAIADPQARTNVRDEVRVVAAEGLKPALRKHNPWASVGPSSQ